MYRNYDQMDNSSNLFYYISFLMNPEEITCCICNIIPESLYIICKPFCIKYSYCLNCINQLNYKCPFTRVSFTIEDIDLDYKNNDFLEIYKKFNKIKIKNISCDITFDSKIITETA